MTPISVVKHLTVNVVVVVAADVVAAAVVFVFVFGGLHLLR